MRKMKLTTAANMVGWITHPYLEGQGYFTADGRIYLDKGGTRVQLGEIKTIVSEEDTGNTDFSDYYGNLIVEDVSGTYTLYYVKSDGTRVEISGGGGGSTYTAGKNIDITTDIISVEDILLNMSKITYFTNDFVIGQGATAVDESPTEIIKIHKGNTGLNDSKVEIKNAKTYIEDLDFGVW